MSRSKKNKYSGYPPRTNVPVGGVCSLAQCNRQIRNAARPFVLETELRDDLGFPAYFPRISPGMEFSGLNNQTGEMETFRVTSVPLLKPEFSGMERIK